MKVAEPLRKSSRMCLLDDPTTTAGDPVVWLGSGASEMPEARGSYSRVLRDPSGGGREFGWPRELPPLGGHQMPLVYVAEVDLGGGDEARVRRDHVSEFRAHLIATNWSMTFATALLLDRGEYPRWRTSLARELWQIRQKIIASGEPLLDSAGIDAEVHSRRGDSPGGDE